MSTMGLGYSEELRISPRLSHNARVVAGGIVRGGDSGT